MVRLIITVDNPLQGMFESLAVKLQTQMQNVLDQNGSEIVSYAQSIVPVHTGFLRDSIQYHVEGTVLYVLAAAYYAKYVEYGTRHMKAEPYMRPALDNQLPQLRADLAAAVLNVLQM